MFQTGKIPTQADFENLIDKIPNGDNLGGGGDATLNFVDPSHPKVLGYRFINYDATGSYIFIGFYDDANGAYVPYIIIHCNTSSPAEYDNTPPVRYAILTSEMITAMMLQANDLHSATDSELIGAIPLNVRWNWVGWHHLSNTHRVIKNDLVEEHFFTTTDGSTRVYFKVIYITENDTFPVVSKVIKIGVSGDAVITATYILTSISNMNTYKQELIAILDSADLETTQLLNFINKYMRDIDVTH